MDGPIPGTPEYHRKWTQEKAIRDAANATAAANEQAQMLAPEPTAYTPPDPSGAYGGSQEVTWQPPQDLGAQVSDYEAEMMAQEDAQIQNSLRPMNFAEAAGQGAQFADQRGDGYLDALLSEVSTPSRPNPVRPIREQHAATAEALMGQAQGVQADIGTAKVLERSAMADAYAREARMQQAQIDAQHAKMLRDQQRREQAIEAERHVFKQVQDATDRLNKTPDEDRGRYWSNTKWWQKLAYAISAFADGWVGNEPNQALFAAIEGDIQEQRSIREARRGEVAAASGQLADVRSMYADLANSIGDEDTAMDAMRLARYEQAKSMLMAEQLRNGVPLEMAMANQGIVELDQKINDTSAVIRERLALTPERIGGGRRPLVTGPIRKTMERLQEGDYDEARALRMKGVDVGADAAKQERAGEMDLEKERIKADGSARAKQAEVGTDLRKKVAENSKDWLMVEQLIDDWEARNEGDVPGTGLPLTGTSAQRIENDSFDQLLPQMITKAVTGANSTPEQQEMSKQLASGKWHEMSDEAKRNRLRALKNMASSARRANSRILGEDPDAEPMSRQPIVQTPKAFSTFEPE